MILELASNKDHLSAVVMDEEDYSSCNDDIESNNVTPTKRKRNRRRRRRRRTKAKSKNMTDSTSEPTDDSSTEATCGSSSSSEGSTQSTLVTKKRMQKSKKNNRKRNMNQNVAERVAITEAEKKQYVAMDCEMVGTGYKGSKSMLAHVTIIDWDGCILLDKYVKPTKTVTDYRTFVSGITAEHIEGTEAVDLEICRQMVEDIIEGKTLIGHALKNDFHVLGISHPWELVRDTAKYEAFMKVRFDDGILWPKKLKELVKQKLKRDIQVPGKPHSAFEDALAALDLYKHARHKWEKAMAYKIKKTREILLEQQIITIHNE